VRANATFTNRTSREIQVDRTAFSATCGGTAMQEARNSETFPEQATVQPGQSVSGTVAFYYDASMPQPLRVEVRYGAVDNAGDFPFSTSIAPVLGPQP
jgi:hypothetical protein